jgi:hypothetical protein
MAVVAFAEALAQALEGGEVSAHVVEIVNRVRTNRVQFYFLLSQ